MKLAKPIAYGSILAGGSLHAPANFCLFLCCLLSTESPTRAQDIEVSAGQSIQKAIDTAPSGAVIHVAAGVFQERLTLTKPLTLTGSGWDKTIIEAAANPNAHTDVEKIAFASQLESAADDRARSRLIQAFLSHQGGPTVTVRSAAHVTLRGLTVRGAAATSGSGDAALILFDDAADSQVIDCAAIGPAQNAVEVMNGSITQLNHSPVAAVWHTGVVMGGSRGARPGTVHLADCDIRNCYYAGVALDGGDGSVVERCRISGAAWHGIRYDDGSPTITGNLIFGNARCGIYASGTTHAIVRGNVFWRNEMDAISCWYNNADTIERNTIVGNLREGVEVCGDAKPTLSHNVFADNPIGVDCAQLADRRGGGASGDPQPTIQANLFWHNANDLKRLQKPEPLPSGNDEVDPKFTASDKDNFSLTANSPARQAGSGAADALWVQSPWPLQPAEQAIIPDTDTRDYSKWKKPTGVQ